MSYSRAMSDLSALKGLATIDLYAKQGDFPLFTQEDYESYLPFANQICPLMRSAITKSTTFSEGLEKAYGFLLLGKYAEFNGLVTDAYLYFIEAAKNNCKMAMHRAMSLILQHPDLLGHVSHHNFGNMLAAIVNDLKQIKEWDALAKLAIDLKKLESDIINLPKVDPYQPDNKDKYRFHIDLINQAFALIFKFISRNARLDDQLVKEYLDLVKKNEKLFVPKDNELASYTKVLEKMHDLFSNSNSSRFSNTIETIQILISKRLAYSENKSNPSRFFALQQQKTSIEENVSPRLTQ